MQTAPSWLLAVLIVGTLQDAVEYFQHLLEVLSRAERAAGQRLGPAGNVQTAAAFSFQVEDRVQCSESGRVSYKGTPQNVLALDIDPQAATNKEELEDYKVGRQACSIPGACMAVKQISEYHQFLQLLCIWRSC